MNFSSKLTQSITPYIAGEQPQNMKYVKINTNENPYPPSNMVEKVVKNFEAENLRLYPDPNNTKLIKALAKKYDVKSTNVFVGNGSDEVLAMCFPAFFNPKEEFVAFADITYSFYKVWAKLFNIRIKYIPLADDFSIRIEDYINFDNTVNGIIITNPNAPTAISLSELDLIKIVEANRDKIVIVDEAYADFSDYSMVKYVKEYKNLLVVRTFSKSYNLAGARCGFAIGDPELIKTLNQIKNSFNSYTVNRFTEAVAIAAIEDDDYFKECTNRIIANRNFLNNSLKDMGFIVLPSSANFVFARHKEYSGEYLYEKLKEKGVLVRHFNQDKIADFLRITVGTKEEIDILINTLSKIL